MSEEANDIVINFTREDVDNLIKALWTESYEEQDKKANSKRFYSIHATLRKVYDARDAVTFPPEEEE